jgi:ABC-type enterochelin transport system ATPase subunit
MAEGRLPKIALKWMSKHKRARGRPKKNWMEGIRKAMNERYLNEGQWEDRKQWSLGAGQRRKVSFCPMVEASDHGYVLRTRRSIHVTRYRIRYDISDLLE